MRDILIRPACQGDIAAVAEIHSASWRGTYADILDQSYLNDRVGEDHLALWTRRLRNPEDRQTVLIAETEDAEIAGFVCTYTDKHPKWGSWIDNLHVKERRRGEGIGELLIRSTAVDLTENAKTSGLYVWLFEANRKALDFYLHLGGEVVEREISEIPAASGARILRVVWPDLAKLSRVRRTRNTT